MSELGKRINECRKKNNLTQKQLADKARISLSYLKAIEKGRKKPSIKALARLADALDVDLKYLLREVSKVE